MERSMVFTIGILLICGSLLFLKLQSPSGFFLLDSTSTKDELLELEHHKRHYTFAGNGTCSPPEQLKDGLTHVHCLGAAMPLAPGQTMDGLMFLESPYPKDRNVTVTNQTAQLVAKEDGVLRAVPLNEVYVHHYVSDDRFLLGEGAELRGAYSRMPLPAPLAMIVDGNFTHTDDARLANVQLINTVGVSEADLQPCTECWCNATDIADKGSLWCCKQCPSVNATSPTIDYHLEYNITYRDVAPTDQQIQFMGYDVANGSIEYNIPHSLGPESVHTLIHEVVADKLCPQQHAFNITRCTAHQHRGGLCISMYDAENDALICRSCPVYGSVVGEPGNEAGYVVKIQDDNLLPPYTLQPGGKIRLVSEYDASERRLGVMALFSTWVAGLDGRCMGQFGRVSSHDDTELLVDAGY